MNLIVIDLIIALVVALLSAYKKEGTSKTGAFVFGYVVGLVPLVNLAALAYLLAPKRQQPRTRARAK